MVGILLFFWEGLFTGDMLVPGKVDGHFESIDSFYDFHPETRGPKIPILDLRFLSSKLT